VEGDPDADVPRGGAARRAGARERALASCPFSKFEVPTFENLDL
jgi:hypothetical protein